MGSSIVKKGNCGDEKCGKKKKALRTNKPDSVTPTGVEAPSFIWDRSHDRPLSAYPPARASSPSTPTLLELGISYWVFGIV